MRIPLVRRTAIGTNAVADITAVAAAVGFSYQIDVTEGDDASTVRSRASGTDVYPSADQALDAGEAFAVWVAESETGDAPNRARDLFVEIHREDR